MSSTNKTTYYELSQYVGSDKPTYLGDYNSDMLKIDTGLHAAADAADTALTTANAANSAATSASTTASTALSTAQTASDTASQAQTTAETALTNAGAAQSAAEVAETAARANVITNLAPAYDSSLTYAVDDLVTYIDAQGSGKLYKCIVAVTSPEAFNINKWDDVTTSEVFTKNSKIYIIVHDGVKTFQDMLLEAREFIINTPDYETSKIDVYTGVNTAYVALYHLSGIDDLNTTPILYLQSSVNVYDRLTIRSIRLSGSSAQGHAVTIKNETLPTLTATDYSQIETGDIIVTISR